MTISRKDSRLIMLWSVLILAVPMVIFPARLGLETGSGLFSYALFEIFFYGMVLFFMRSGSTLLQLFQGAALSFLYRITIGTIFGIMISVLYGVSFSAALTLGISRYFPAILLHIVTAPFIIRPLFLAIAGQSRLSSSPRESSPPERPAESPPPYFPKAESRPTVIAATDKPSTEAVLPRDLNGFERAVRYLGEHHAVRVAAVVDAEGLTLANFYRDDADPEVWAPLALLFRDQNRQILSRNLKAADPDRIEMIIGSDKLAVLRAAGVSLMVLSAADEDDLLGVRLNQAADIIRKYISERYGSLLPSSPEEKYVSGT